MYGWASGAGAGLDVIYQMLGNLADGRHIGAVIVAAAVGFLQQQSGVIQAVKVPEHGAGIQVQLLGQLLAAHGPLHHQPKHLHAGGVCHEPHSCKLPLLRRLGAAGRLQTGLHADAQMKPCVLAIVGIFARGRSRGQKPERDFQLLHADIRHPGPVKEKLLGGVELKEGLPLLGIRFQIQSETVQQNETIALEVKTAQDHFRDLTKMI